MRKYLVGDRVRASDPRAGAVREPATVRVVHPQPRPMLDWYTVEFDSVPGRLLGLWSDDLEPIGYAELDGLEVCVV